MRAWLGSGVGVGVGVGLGLGLGLDARRHEVEARPMLGLRMRLLEQLGARALGGKERAQVVQGLARREDARIGEQLVVPQHLMCVGGDN